MTENITEAINRFKGVMATNPDHVVSSDLEDLAQSLMHEAEIVVSEPAETIKEDTVEDSEEDADIVDAQFTEVVPDKPEGPDDGRRPWGSFKIIEEFERYKVKLLQVSPGKKLSLQKHYHRNEHWVIVAGTARVIKGDTELILTENQSVYIEIGQVHRLENPGKIVLKVIEVQVGTYLGEDDIERLDDDFNRL